MAQDQDISPESKPCPQDKKWTDYLSEIQLHLKNREAEKAINTCLDACKAFPENPSLFNLLSISYANSGDAAKARAALEQATGKGLPDEAHFHQEMKISLIEKDLARFAAFGDKLHSTGAEIPETQLIRLIQANSELKNWDRMEKYADICLEKHPSTYLVHQKFIAALLSDNLSNPIKVLEDRFFGPNGSPE